MLIGLTPMILAFSNPKLALLRKYFKFGQVFRVSLLTKRIAVAISISLAFWFRDYRALVYGLIAGSIIKIIVEYLVIPYRPRFCLRRRNELLSFSAWLLVRNVASAAFARVEQLILGASFGAPRTSY